MDPTKLAPPAMAGIVEWIAVALVSLLVFVVFWWITKGSPAAHAAAAAERKEAVDERTTALDECRKERETLLAAYREEGRLEREHHSTAVAGIHRRFDELLEAVHDEEPEPRRRRRDDQALPRAG